MVSENDTILEMLNCFYNVEVLIQPKWLTEPKIVSLS